MKTNFQKSSMYKFISRRSTICRCPGCRKGIIKFFNERADVFPYTADNISERPPICECFCDRIGIYFTMHLR